MFFGKKGACPAAEMDNSRKMGDRPSQELHRIGKLSPKRQCWRFGLRKTATDLGCFA
jgi:hypothetical protein